MRAFRPVALAAAITLLLLGLLLMPAIAGAEPTTVVVVRSGWLASEFGSQKAAPLTASLEQIGVVVSLPAEVVSPTEVKNYMWQTLSRIGVQRKDVQALQIVGGPEEVPYWSLPFFLQGDDDTAIRSDDPYGVFSGSGAFSADDVVDVPVARLPDGGSLRLLERQLLEPPGKPTSDAYLLSMQESSRLRRAKQVVARLRGASFLETSPPVDYSKNAITTHGYGTTYKDTFFILHGSDRDTSLYWGEANKPWWNLGGGSYMPIAFRAQDATSSGVVFSGACYGALIKPKADPSSSIALHFLLTGARCFVGSTESSYTTWDDQGGSMGGTLMSDVFSSEVARTDDPLAAFLSAKEKAAQKAKKSGDKPTWKAAHEYLYYGVVPPEYWTGAASPGSSKTGGAATSLVIDVSGTMSNEYQGEIKLSQAKDAANDVAGVIAGYGNMTKTGAQVAVSSFSNGAATVQSLTSDVDAIRASVDALQTEDMTNVGAGIEDGIAQLDAAKSGSEKVMILLSDGLNNEGMTNEEVLAGPVEEARQKDIKIFTVGFGDVGDLDPDFLQEIADATGGEYELADATTIANSVAGKFVKAQIEATQDILAENEGTVAQGETTEAGTFAVPTTSGDVQAVLLWPGSTLRLDLTDPTGVKVGPGYPGYKQSTGEGPAQIVVQGAKSGTWTSSVYGEQVSMAEEPFYSIVSFKKVKRAAAVSGGGAGNNAGAGIIIAVILVAAGAGVVWLVVAATRKREPEMAMVGGGLASGPRGGEATGAHAFLVDERGVRYPLRQGPNSVGRELGNDIVLDAPSVSRRHAVLSLGTQGLEVRDEGSATGLFINGERVSSGVLRDGDQVSFGPTRMTVAYRGSGEIV